jgi:hypothetical protein
MPDYRFEREARTAYSESYSVWDGEKASGRVDIHYTPAAVYATICIGEGLNEEQIQEIIGAVDDELVMTADPYRDDFVATVWSGKEIGVYSDDDIDDIDDEFMEDLDSEGNGTRP